MEVKPNQIRLTLVHQCAEDRLPGKYPQDLQRRLTSSGSAVTTLELHVCLMVSQVSKHTDHIRPRASHVKEEG